MYQCVPEELAWLAISGIIEKVQKEHEGVSVILIFFGDATKGFWLSGVSWCYCKKKTSTGVIVISPGIKT